MTPEIQRDGTNFSERSWVDGQWCRFYQNNPKKMGGFKEIINNIPNVPRGIMVVPNYPYFRIFIGTYNKLYYQDIDEDGIAVGTLEDITPAGFATYANVNNTWDFDVIYFSDEGKNVLVANAAPNLAGIANNVETPVYYGDLLPLTPTPPAQLSTFVASGGIVAMHPYLFFYGNDGSISWVSETNPTVIISTERPTSNKIVYALPCRAGNSSPAGLFWSLDCLIRATHTGQSDIDFTFDSVTCESSILSSQGIIEYDGTFYWAGVDRFLMYNGTVQELPNDTNLLYFFNNIDMDYRQKVWATKNTKWGEIWWFYPMIGSTECNAAIIYNVRTKKWIDTFINRSDGEFDQTFASPIWADNVANGSGEYSLWMHEVGVNKVPLTGGPVAIDSYIQSGDISWCAYDPNAQRQGVDRWTKIYRLEPDMFQTGDITLTVGGKEYARGSDYPVTYTISDTAVKVDLNEQRRIMYLKFRSNVVDGDFEMGQHLMVMRVGDARQ